MSEQKVWIDNEEYFGADFKDIKNHDRELVKEVCEKIHNDLKPHYGEEVSGFVIERVLSNLQKEYEK